MFWPQLIKVHFSLGHLRALRDVSFDTDVHKWALQQHELTFYLIHFSFKCSPEKLSLVCLKITVCGFRFTSSQPGCGLHHLCKVSILLGLDVVSRYIVLQKQLICAKHMWLQNVSLGHWCNGSYVMCQYTVLYCMYNTMELHMTGNWILQSAQFVVVVHIFAWRAWLKMHFSWQLQQLIWSEKDMLEGSGAWGPAWYYKPEWLSD